MNFCDLYAVQVDPLNTCPYCQSPSYISIYLRVKLLTQGLNPFYPLQKERLLPKFIYLTKDHMIRSDVTHTNVCRVALRAFSHCGLIPMT